MTLKVIFIPMMELAIIIPRICQLVVILFLYLVGRSITSSSEAPRIYKLLSEKTDLVFFNLIEYVIITFKFIIILSKLLGIFPFFFSWKPISSKIDLSD